MTNYDNTVFYIGVSSNFIGRVWQHKQKVHPNSFTAKYNVKKLVYSAEFPTALEAISAEKRLKNWKRQWKIELIQKENPNFEDLSKDWLEG
jgi:putative endonuclease